jgi:hypothetical protein
MPDWQERITRQTDPAARADHLLRYAAIEPLLAGTVAWCDLGAGSAPPAVPRPAFEGRLILVGGDRDTVAQARQRTEAQDVVEVVADLERREDIQRVSDALRDAPQGHRLVTCFGVIERLAGFSLLLDALIAGAGEGVTVVLSVPNEAFAPGVDKGDRKSVWGPGAFEELRRLLPDDARIAHQVSLQGSSLLAVEGEKASPASLDAAVAAGELGSPPTHFVAAFGPRAGELKLPGVAVVEADRLEERRWAARRDSDLAFYQAANRELEEEVRRLRERLTAAGQPVDAPPGASVVELRGPEGSGQAS